MFTEFFQKVIKNSRILMRSIRNFSIFYGEEQNMLDSQIS